MPLSSLRVAFTALVLAARIAAAQNEPFPVHDTKPVITHGPIIVDASETGVTILWTTDTPSHSEVRYGEASELNRRAESSHDGLIDMGTVHRIRVNGLTPGRTYNYQVASTRVVKMKAYWPEKGLEVASAVGRFTTLDRNAPVVRFSSISDTHENVARIDSLMKAIPWSETNFLVHTGDAFDWIDSEDQLFAKWLDPIGKGLAASKPLIYARGNHDLRGPFARELAFYVRNPDELFYHARDAGPVHLYVMDSGEDKADSTNVYARLNRSEPYLKTELEWLANHARTDQRALAAPFRVAVVHQPNWGSMADGRAEWQRTLNAANVDLVIAGHTHRFSRTDAGTNGANYTTIVVGQGQVANVTATSTSLSVVVRSATGTVVDSSSIAVRRR